MITAICVQLNNGYWDSYEELELGKTYEVCFAIVDRCRTDVYLKGMPHSYNSVCFRFYKDNKAIDIVEEFKDSYSKDNTSSIWRLFVDRRCRRCGLASKMFSIAENFANGAGFDKIYLHTHKNLDGALEFWSKMGFVIVLDANDELETVHMDKKIRGLDINHQVSDFSHAVKL